MRICNETCNTLRRPSGAYHASPFLQATLALTAGGQTLEAFIENPLDGALGDAKVAGAESLVKPADALFARYLPDHRDASADERRLRRRRGHPGDLV